MKNRVKIYPVIVLVILAFALSSMPLGSVATAQEPPPSTRAPLDVILVLDQSGSMFIYSDQLVVDKDDEGRIIGYEQWPLRQVGASYFVDYMGIEPRHLQHRVGSVYFGTEAELPVSLFDVADKEKRDGAVDFLYRVPPDMKWTNTNDALMAAYRELFESGRHDPTHRPVVVLLSDGHPELADPWPDEDKERYYKRHLEIVDMFKDRGCPLFTIIISATDEEGKSYVDEEDTYLKAHPELGSYVNVWQQAADQTGGDYYRLQYYDRPDELLDIYHAILAKLLGIFVLGEPIIGPILSTPQTILIPVGKCRGLVVSVDKTSPEATVTLRDPDGDIIGPDARRPLYELYSITDPVEGNWSLVLGPGTGSYRIRLDCEETELQSQFLSPTTVHPLCKPMRVAVRLFDDKGAPVTDALAAVRVTWPDGSPGGDLPLASEGDGVYSAILKNTGQEGQYKLSLIVHQAGRTISADKVVSVIPMLYLDFVDPIPDTPYEYPGGDLVIQAALKEGCELVEDPMLSGKGTKVTATLTDASGRQVASVRLKDDGKAPDKEEVDGIFGGILKGVKGGDYTLTVELVNDRIKAYDTISGLIHVGQPVPTDTPAPTNTPAPPAPTSTPAPPTPIPTPGPTPTPVRAVISLDKADLGRVRAGQTMRVRLHINGEALTEEQTVALALDGVPFELEQTEIQAPPGRADYQTDVTIRIPEELDPRQQGEEHHVYEGRLCLTYPDGKTSDLTFEVEVLPPPIPSWIYLIVALGLVAVGGTGFAAYRWQTGMGRLTGKIVYLATPPSVGSLPDEELYGQKHVIVLDELPEIGASPAQAAYDSEAEDETLGEERLEEFASFEEMPLEAPESLHTELTFTARRGHTEARVTVTKTSGQVLLDQVPLGEGDPPQLLRDGDTISVGRYTLKYESLALVESAEDFGEESFWGEEGEEAYGFGEEPFEDYREYGEGGDYEGGEAVSDISGDGVGDGYEGETFDDDFDY